MFETIELTELYTLERRLSRGEIIRRYGERRVAIGISVKDYYEMLRFFGG